VENEVEEVVEEVELVVELVEELVELVELVELLVEEVEEVDDVVEVVPHTLLSRNMPSSKQSVFLEYPAKGRVDDPERTAFSRLVCTVALNL
jgi:hypothetical protein